MTDEAPERRRRAARATSARGPGTTGHTTSGAAYRGAEVAASTGAPPAADPGFPVTAVGLHPGQGQDTRGTTAPPDVWAGAPEPGGDFS